MIPLINMQLGEIIVGGVGAGLYGMLIFVIVAIFVAGLMVGRTPEYLGKKIEAKEVKMAMLAILCLPLCMLGFTAIAVVLPAGGRLDRPMPARTASRRSSTPTPRRPANNGSAFGGLTGNTLWYNMTLGSHAGRPLLRDHPGAGHRRLAGGQEDGAGLRRHLPDRWRRSSSACSSASS